MPTIRSDAILVGHLTSLNSIILDIDSCTFPSGRNI